MFVAAAPALALPLISELFYDAVGSDDGGSFVELYGEPGSLLDGLTLEGVNGSGGAVTHSILLSGVIPADGLFVLADVDGSGMTLVPNADAVVNFDFQNGPDSVVLRDAAGVVDAVGYGVFDAADVFAGEGTPAPDAPAGSSLARWFADADTDDNAFDFTIQDVPTPGSAPLMVPEPGTGALFVSALLAVVATGRRAGRGDSQLAAFAARLGRHAGPTASPTVALAREPHSRPRGRRDGRTSLAQARGDGRSAPPLRVHRSGA